MSAASRTHLVLASSAASRAVSAQPLCRCPSVGSFRGHSSKTDCRVMVGTNKTGLISPTNASRIAGVTKKVSRSSLSSKTPVSNHISGSGRVRKNSCRFGLRMGTWDRISIVPATAAASGDSRKASRLAKMLAGAGLPSKTMLLAPTRLPSVKAVLDMIDFPFLELRHVLHGTAI